MCLVNFAFGVHPNYPLIVAANRDEIYTRRTKQAHFWKESPQLLAGKDLEKGGTWLGITREGRFAALTNYREVFDHNKTFRSRGELVSEYLLSSVSDEDYLRSLSAKKEEYDGFNLIFGNKEQLYYFSNRLQGEGISIEKGIHSLSNGFLTSNWPKTEKGKSLLQRCLKEGESTLETCLLFGLQDDTLAPVHLLPNTGVGVELEKNLSPMFIKMDKYGTRSSTVILIDTIGKVRFIERTYAQTKERFSDVSFSFSIEKEGR